MLSPAQAANIATVFDALDATEDARITRDDVLRRADQLCAGLALDDASAAHREIQSAYRQLWDELMRFADVNEDGGVTLEEFLDAVDRGMLEDPGFVDSAMLVVTHACFTAVDRDSDDAISLEEYASAFTAIDPSKDDLAAAGFAVLDRDGDGLISRAELVAAMRALFVSSDEPPSRGARVLR